MDTYQAIILGFIQGFTEFLPISSSAHLILLPELTDLPDQGLSFDIVMHFATLMAVVLYYRKDIKVIIYDFFTHKPNFEQKFQITHQNNIIGWGLVIGTIPVGIFGLLFKDYIELNLRSTEVIAWASIFFGLLLYLADYLHKQKDNLQDLLTIKHMFIIGIFQAIALIPGTSRSGITITAGLLLGLGYKTATKFAFLLSIPVIVLSMGLISIDLIKEPQNIDITILFSGFITAFITAYLTIYLFIKIIEKISMLPFLIYRLILGVLLLML